MYKTLKLMSQIRDTRLTNLNNEELVDLYQTGNKSQDTIISEIFCKNFELFLKIYKKFPTLDSSERISNLLQWTDTSLKRFKKSIGVKFDTFLYGNLTKRLLSIYSKSIRKGRKENANPLSIDDTTEDGYMISELIADNSNEFEKLDYKIWIESNKELTTEEKWYCMQFLHTDKPKAQDVKREIGLDPMGAYLLRQKLKTKIKNELEREK